LPQNGHRIGAAPPDAIADWIAQVMADTDQFFTPPPTDKYRLTSEEVSGATRSAGEATLTFPSALETPHHENNTVYCRYFPGSARSADQPSRAAVLVLPQWNADPAGHFRLCRLLAWNG